MAEGAWWERKLVRVALLVLTVAVFGCATWLASLLQQGGFPPPESRVLRPAAIRVGPGVYLLGKLSPAAAYVFETSEGLILVDTGKQANAAAIVDQLRELRLDVAQLRAILLTHVHVDHSQGAARLRELTGAKVHVGRGDAEALRQGKNRVAFVSIFHEPQLELHPTPVDVELAGGETLTFGDTRVQVIATPGHTAGGVSYLVERKGVRALATGDIVQSLTPGHPGTLGIYSAYLSPHYGGNARDFLASLRKLRELPVPHLLLPGHPRNDPTPQDPYLSEQRWHALLDPGIAELEKLVARYQADGADFLDGEPRELLPGLGYLGNLGSSGGQAFYALNTPKGLFLVDAPGGPSLAEGLAGRLGKLGWKDRKPAAVLLTSGDKATTAGLEALVRKTGCKVVAPKAAMNAVRRLCPPGTELLDEEDLGRRGWFDVRAIPLGGRGLAPLAYVVRVAGKTILLSGRMPVKANVQVIEDLTGDLTAPGGDRAEFQRSLQRLGEVTPDLWLPALPVHGQNANLYDGEWAKVLQQNREFISW